MIKSFTEIERYIGNRFNRYMNALTDDKRERIYR